MGLKTTLVRSLNGEQIIIPNSDLTKCRIRNYKRQIDRRVVFGFGVSHETPLDELAMIPRMLKQIITSQPDVRFDRAHFKSYGDSALLFEAVYSVTNPDYNRYMDIQQAINLAILRRLREEQVQLAHPTRTVRLEDANPGRQAGGNLVAGDPSDRVPVASTG